MPLSPITTLENLVEFRDILASNPGLVVLKLSADWCAPCKRIRPEMEVGLANLPSNVQPVLIDIDESLEIFSYLKNKKRVNGIPAILCWKRGNVSDIPDDVVLGADVGQVQGFFQRCQTYASAVSGGGTA